MDGSRLGGRTMRCESSTAARAPVPLRELEAQITELAGQLNAATYRLLALIAEFDRRHGWSDGSTASCAHWLNWKCGIDLGAAREKVRVAHALEKLPRIAAAMQRGQLSYSKVRALTRVACDNTEEYLLQIALHGTASHVETLVRQYRRARESEEWSREARQQATRGLRYYYDEDGSLVLKGRLPAEVGALFVKAIDAAMAEEGVPAEGVGKEVVELEQEQERMHEGAAQECAAVEGDVSAETCTDALEGTSDDPSADSSAERPDGRPVERAEPAESRESFAARRADALGRIAESFLKHGPAALSGGERHQIVVHVEAETLQEGGAGRCELEDGPSIPVETARRLACDSSVVTILEDGEGEPLSVGRKTRSIPAALRRALKSRDRGCRFPGCGNQRYVDAHHIQHWAEGGETKPSNLVTLCRFHHRQVHEGRVAIEVLDDGALRFVRPDGEAFDSAVADAGRLPADWQALGAAHRERGIHIEADTAVTRWRGERMDHGLAIEVLFQRARRGGVSAEMSAQTQLGVRGFNAG
jgi:hypothetical protein